MPISRDRLRPLARKVQPREKTKLYRLFCEGECTEPSYFLTFGRARHLPARFDTKDSGADPQKLLELARDYANDERKAIKDGDIEVWIVCDRDGHAHDDKAADLQSENIHVAFSNPCFELWLLLHFEYCSRPFHTDQEVGPVDRDALQDEVGEYLDGFDPEQKTIHAKHYPELARRYESARTNAIRLAKELNESGQSRLEKTNTNVHDLVERILDCIDERRENTQNIQLPEWIETMIRGRAGRAAAVEK